MPTTTSAGLSIQGVSGTDAAGNPIDAAGHPVTDGSKLAAGPAPLVQMNGRLAIFLKGDENTVIDPTKAVLALDGRPVANLNDTVYLGKIHALIFHLLRNTDNADAWQPILGSPSLTPRSVAVGFWPDKALMGGDEKSLILDEHGAAPTFRLAVISGWWVMGAVLAVVVILVAIWTAATRTNLLKDDLLPQLSQAETPYSLGRTQMAFWFVLIFASFIALFVMMQDFNTITTQSLVLMGLSGATGVFAMAVDASKDTPIGAANETLRALGLKSYEDVRNLDQEVAQRQKALQQPNLDDATKLRLQTEIADRLNKKRSYHDITRPFVSDGWYRDLTTDINGPALHRVQVFFWTLALGAVFVIEVYRQLSMPQFSQTLLALMGVTSAGYIGFKYTETQN
ncbi:MAG: hypothetical protein ABWY00_13210 [Dongiaceae bacterium]